MKLIFDAHLDLSLNALDYNRDLRRELEVIRAEEAGMTDRHGRGNGTVCFRRCGEGGWGSAWLLSSPGA